MIDKTGKVLYNINGGTFIQYNKLKKTVILYMNIKKLFCLITASLFLAGCAAKETKSNNNNNNEKTVITMMYISDLPNLEKLVETTYGNIDLQIETNASGTIDGEIERRLRNGHGTDIVASTLAIGDILDHLADLSADDYISAYQSGIMHKTAKDGKNFFIPLPAQYYGYIYNKSLLEQNGFDIPETQEELLEILEESKKKNIAVDENGNNFVVDGTPAVTAIFAMSSKIPDFFGLADGINWLNDLKNGEAVFSGTLENCLDLPLELIDKGYLNSMPFQALTNSMPVHQKMADGKALVAFDNVKMLEIIRQSSDYEFDMLPILSNEGNPSWTASAPTAFLGINNELTKDENKARLDACRKIFALISTPEGQNALMLDNGAAYSYLVDYSPAFDIVPDGIENCIENGYNYNISISTDFMRYFGNRCNAVLCGQIEITEALADVDEYIKNGSQETNALIGTVNHDMIVENYNVRQQETEIGNLISDAVREAVGADIAVVNGGSIRGSLYKGDVYSYDLDAICPYPNKVIVIEVNAEVIREMLANSLTMMINDNNIPGGRFLNVSGIKYSFTRPSADKPAQLVDVTLPDGSPLDENRTYTIAVTDYMAGKSGYLDNNGDGYTMINIYSNDVPKAENVKLVKETEYTFSSILEDFIVDHNDEEIVSQIDGRITMVD